MIYVSQANDRRAEYSVETPCVDHHPRPGSGGTASANSLRAVAMKRLPRGVLLGLKKSAWHSLLLREGTWRGGTGRLGQGGFTVRGSYWVHTTVKQKVR